MERMIIGWLFEALFDLIIELAENLAQRSDTQLDDEAVGKFKSHRSKFIALTKGKL